MDYEIKKTLDDNGNVVKAEIVYKEPKEAPKLPKKKSKLSSNDL